MRSVEPACRLCTPTHVHLMSTLMSATWNALLKTWWCSCTKSGTQESSTETHAWLGKWHISTQVPCLAFSRMSALLVSFMSSFVLDAPDTVSGCIFTSSSSFVAGHSWVLVLCLAHKSSAIKCFCAACPLGGLVWGTKPVLYPTPPQASVIQHVFAAVLFSGRGVALSTELP